jgi:hypothetical protein
MHIPPCLISGTQRQSRLSPVTLRNAWKAFLDTLPALNARIAPVADRLAAANGGRAGRIVSRRGLNEAFVDTRSRLPMRRPLHAPRSR